MVVHRRKERKHALRRRSGPSPEKAKKRDSLHITHAENNESIKRDERERIGHHADRTASVQVCVCFRTSLFSFFSIVPPFTLRRRSVGKRAKSAPPTGKKRLFFREKKRRGVPVRERNLSLSLPLLLSSALCARVKCDGAVIIALRRRKRRRRRTLCSSFFFIFFCSLLLPQRKLFFFSRVELTKNTNNADTCFIRARTRYSRTKETNRHGLDGAQPDVFRPSVQSENDRAEEVLREAEHGHRAGGRDDGGDGDHASAERSAGGFGKLPG